MIYVPLQDLHLVQSMNWISELSRRYHSVRMHILTPYGEVFPTRPVGNGSTYWIKGRGLTLPSFLFSFFVPCILGPWVRGFSMRTEKDRRVTLGKPTKEEASKSISVDQKWLSSRRLVKLLSLFVDVMQVRRWSLWGHTMRAPRTTASYMPWLPVSRDTYVERGSIPGRDS